MSEIVLWTNASGDSCVANWSDADLKLGLECAVADDNYVMRNAIIKELQRRVEQNRNN